MEAEKPKPKHRIPNPNPPGQPTRYKPEFCDDLVKHMAEGHSFESFGATVWVSRTTLYNWEAAHPAFLDAHAIGLEMSLLFYEDMLRLLIAGKLKNGSSYALKMALHNMHGWRDRKDVNVAGQGDKAPPVRMDLSGKSIDELETRLTELMLKVKKAASKPEAK